MAAVETASPEALLRWCVNYVRHDGTVYDRALEKLYARTGREDATRLLRRRIYSEIAKQYPWLAAETDRQLAVREAEA